MFKYTKLLFASFSFCLYFLLFPSTVKALVQSTFTTDNRWMVDKAVEAITVGGDGTVYVGGTFVDVFDARSSTINQVHGWNLETQQVVTTTPLALLNGTFTIASDQAGGWFIAAASGLYPANSTTLRYLVHLNADYTLDLNFLPIVTTTISDMVVRSSTLYIGGSFRFINNIARDRLAALDFNGNLLSWAPGVNSNVNTIAIDPAGLTSTIFVGGAFTTTSFAGATRTRAAAFDINGQITDWAPQVTSTASASQVAQIMLDPTGATTTIFLAGTFNSINSTTVRNMFAAVDRDTGTTTAWAPNTSATSITRRQAMAMASNTIYLSGSFTSVRGGVSGVTSTQNRIVAVDMSGDVVSNWLLDDSGTPSGIMYRTNTLYIFDAGGNTASTTAQAPRTISAMWGVNVDTLQITMEMPLGSGPLVYAADISGNILMTNTTVIGVGNIKRDRIFAYDSNRNLKSFYPRLNNSVLAILVTTDTVYLGGTFTTSTGDVLRHRLAAFDFDGNLLPWSPKVNGTVNSLAISPDGNTIYAGGSFTTTSDAGTRNRVAAFDRDGNTLSWNPGANNTVNKILVAPSSITSSVFYFGTFTTTTAGSRNRAAAVDVNGVLNGNFNPNIGTSGVENASFDTSLATSSVFVVGVFTTVNSSVTRNRAAAFDMNGTVTQWNPNMGSTVNDLVVTTSSVFMVGAFTTIGSTTTRSSGGEVDKNTGAIKSWEPFFVSGTSAKTITLGPNAMYVGSNGPFFYMYGGTVWTGIGEYDLHRTGSSITASTIAESAGSVNLEFMLNVASSATSTMSYSLAGTATTGDDYVFSTGTISILPGALTTTISVTITDDTTHESDETIIMTLSSPDESYISTSTLTLSITDDDVATVTSGTGYSPPLTGDSGILQTSTSTTSTPIFLAPLKPSETPLEPISTPNVSEPITIVVPIFVNPKPPRIVLKKNVSINQTSIDVKTIQQVLNKLGFTVAKNGAGSPGKETTYFGPATRRAVIRFQETYATDILVPNRLRAGTGTVGPATLKKMNELLQK